MESQAEIQTMTFRQFFKMRMEAWMARRDEKWRAKWLQSTRGQAFDASINAGIAIENTHRQFGDICRLSSDLVSQKCVSDMHSNQLTALRLRLERIERVMRSVREELNSLDDPIHTYPERDLFWTKPHKAAETDEDIDAVIYGGPGDR